MARKRNATALLEELDRATVHRALDASLAAGSMKEFYGIVGMRNPSRSYFVRYEHKLHSLKAVVTYSLREKWPQVGSRDFHASDAANRLGQLRFSVVHNLNDEDSIREREWISRLSRPAQAEFRSKLVDMYGRCALSGCTTLAALEAAHVKPVAGYGADRVSNGILLRADLHKLFDANLIAIEPSSGRLKLAPDCEADYVPMLSDVIFTSPPGGPKLPDFQDRWNEFNSILRKSVKPGPTVREGRQDNQIP